MNTWMERDLQVLGHLVELDRESEDGYFGDAKHLAAPLSLPESEAVKSVRLLAKDGFLRGQGYAGGYLISEVLPRAYREVGQWPSGTFDRERLLAALDRLVDQLEDADEKRRVESLRENAAVFASETLRDILVAFGMAGIGA